jgi:hypothetical protein
MNQIMRFFCLLLFLLFLRTTATGQSNKDIAGKRIASCYATDLRGKGCSIQSLLNDGKVLLTAYKGGDKSLLGSLMQVNALSLGLNLNGKILAHAMLDDTSGFLLALSSTQNTNDTWRNSTAIGSACDCQGINLHEFNAAREKLRSVPKESAFSSLAQQCRRDLEGANATLIYTYFPPKTFQSGAGDFMVQWYSGVLYGLGEQPLWPADPKLVTYRFVWMRSFHDQVSITMTVQPEGNGKLRLQIYRRASQQLESRTQSLSKEQVGQVISLIDKSNFWNLTTEGEGPQGTDGAEWVLEGVRNGKYHIVTRWDASRSDYGKALLELLRLSKYNPPENEIY